MTATLDALVPKKKDNAEPTAEQKAAEAGGATGPRPLPDQQAAAEMPVPGHPVP